MDARVLDGLSVVSFAVPGALGSVGPGVRLFESGVGGCVHPAFSGFGRVSGTVMVSPGTPVRRRVRLFEESSGVLVGEVWSNGDTGVYSFGFVDPARRYTVLSYDHLGTFRAVVADRVVPEVSP